ncbi:MAG TPA: hypothetical protein VKZ63_22730 [Kofleriaceae bacterium]|nr:hypothetical protein [Kofleriaceae bacterium]
MTRGHLAAASLSLSLALAHLASAAAADPYGEPPPEREGFLFGLGLGPAIFVGGGGEVEDVQGIGGDLNLRVGTSAGERLLWLVELQSGGYLIELETSAQTDTVYNALSTLAVSAQLYIENALWLRGGAGLAAFVEQEGRGGTEVEGSRRGGLGLTAGGGYDLFRRGSFALSVEAAVAAGVFSSGVIARSGLLLGLTWY